MNWFADLAPLNPTQRKQVLELVDRFERAGQGDADVDLKEFAPPVGNPLRPLILSKLVQSDLENRWRRRRGVYLEDYCRRFPDLGTAQTVSAQLIYQEYCVRHRYGDKPEAASYAPRFPTQFPEFQRLLERQSSPGPETPNESAKAVSEAYPVTRRDLVPHAAPAANLPPAADQRGMLPVGGGYKLIKQLGSGGFGEVWQAEAPGGVGVAVKIIYRPLDHEDAKRELQALELIKGLHHAFLLQTQAYWSLENQLLILMDLADGHLRDYLERYRRENQSEVPLKDLVRFFREAAEALDYLHSQQLQHRDIKPENILLLGAHVKVADFGLASLQGAHSLVTATMSGTPAYMAPEIWSGKVHKNSDLYSLAITYAEMRLNRRLFSCRQLTELMLEHLQGTPNLDPLPLAEQQVLLKAMAKDPAQRYPSCLAFVQALEGALAHELRSTPSLSSLEGDAAQNQRVAGKASSRTSTRWPLVWLAIVIMVGTFVVLRVIISPPPGSFSLVKPEPLQLAQGEKKVVAIRLNRNHFKDPIAIASEESRNGVWLTGPSAPTDADEVAIHLEAGPNATPGDWKVTVRAESGTQSQETVLDLTVLFLPPHCEKVGDETDKDYDQKQYYKHIARLLDDGSRIDFVLIPKKSKDDLHHTFYMMEQKVSVGQFRQFARTHAEVVKSEDWKQYDDECPALGVRVVEAHRFAESLQGKLPTTRQWDTAAGFYKQPREGEGPYRGIWKGPGTLQIAVGRLKKPWKLSAATDDLSPYECRNMAGNGPEWTRTVISNDPAKREVPIANPNSSDEVCLRGKGFWTENPFWYKDLLNSNLATESYIEPPPYRNGFRVVIEP